MSKASRFALISIVAIIMKSSARCPIKRCLSTSIFAFFVCFSLLRPALAQDPSSIIATGSKLFAADCSSCHRSNGSGGISFGTTSSTDLRAPELEEAYRFDDSLILRAILDAEDQNGAKLSPPMPAWKGRLSVPDAKAIVAYLHILHS
jgi:mono/diheme cytochrome c family protein